MLENAIERMVIFMDKVLIARLQGAGVPKDMAVLADQLKDGAARWLNMEVQAVSDRPFRDFQSIEISHRFCHLSECHVCKNRNHG